MAKRVLIDGLPGESRAAVLADDDTLTELLIQRADRPSVAGNRYLGRVARVVPALNAAFVEIGLARPGLLPLKAVEGKPTEGQALAVRVTREPSPGKGAKLSAKEVAAPADGAQPPCLLAEADPLAELLRRVAPEHILVEGAERRRDLAETVPDLANRLEGHRGVRPLFDSYDLNAEIAALLAPEVPLPGGGLLRIEPVETLTAIDVDAAGHAAGDAARTALEVDLAAAGEVVRQLRLRALSGLIVIDFLELETKDARRQVAEALQAGFEAAEVEASVSPMRASGLVELTVPRRRLPLHEVLGERVGWIADPVTVALTLIRQAGREAAANPGRALTLVAAPEVTAAFEAGAAAAFQDLSRRLGVAPTVRADASRPRESTDILLA